MVRKLRIFLCELIGVGLLLGWLMWKYPELVETIVPWIALAVALHITWEFIIEPCRAGLTKISRQMPPEVKWIFIILGTILISLFYLREIKAGLTALSTYHAKYEASHAAPSSAPPNEPGTKPPSIPDKPKSVLAVNFNRSIVNFNRDLGRHLPIWVFYPTIQGDAVSPVAAIVYVDITNVSPHLQTISTYHLSVRTRQCPWMELIPIYLHDVKVYWIYDNIREARLMDFTTDGLDYKLADPIPSYQSIHGWLFFDTTTKCEVQGKELQWRLFGETFGGEKYDVLDKWGMVEGKINPRSSSQGQSPGPKLIFPPGKPVDLSSAIIRFFAN